MNYSKISKGGEQLEVLTKIPTYKNMGADSKEFLTQK